MEGKASDQATGCQEFEPYCKWQRNEERDIIELHLQEFKRDQLKVQISNRGILKISGERPVDASTKAQFYKEIPVPSNIYDSAAIHAKFLNGCLCITMPKKKILDRQIGGNYKSAEGPKAPPPKGIGGVAKSQTLTQLGRERRALRLVKVVLKLAATAAAVAVLVAYVVYMYKSTVGEVDIIEN